MFIHSKNVGDIFTNCRTDTYYKDFDENHYYQRRNRGGSFSPAVIVLLKTGDKYSVIWSMTPIRMDFLLKEASSIVVQAIIVTEPKSSAEIPPTKEVQEVILENGICDTKTGRVTDVQKTVIVGLGG